MVSNGNSKLIFVPKRISLGSLKSMYFSLNKGRGLSHLPPFRKEESFTAQPSSLEN